MIITALPSVGRLVVMAIDVEVHIRILVNLYTQCVLGDIVHIPELLVVFLDREHSGDNESSGYTQHAHTQILLFGIFTCR